MAPQVLVLGMPRTGTQSIGEALSLLGFKNAYHMTTVGPNDHHDKWVAALEAKFEGKGPEFGKKEFDELFQDYSVASDIPSSIFYRELMTAYPDAKLILTTRPEDAWVASMATTLHLAYTQAKAAPSRLAQLYHRYLWGEDFLANGRAAFRSHNAGVLQAAKEMGREVLIFDPTQGWEALCGFLGQEVPEVAYPRKDMWVGYKQMVKDVEAGRLTEDAISIRQPVMRGNGREGIKSAYIYTQQKEGGLMKPTGEGIKSAYIYTQQKEGAGLPKSSGEGIKSAYIYTQQKEGGLLKSTGEGIKSAYIYTQQKEGEGLPRSSGEGIKSAYIYTQQKEGGLLKSTGEGIKSAYIYTQQKENDILRSTGEGIKSAYIYTQQKESDILHSTGEGIKSAYIYTQQKENDVLRSNGEGIRSAYIYTQQKEHDVLRSNGEGIRSAYIYTQQKENGILQSTGEGIRSAYIYTQQKEHDILRPAGEGMKAAYIYTQ